MRRPTLYVIAALALVMQSGLPAVALGSSATAGTTTLSTGRWAVTPVATATSTTTGSAFLINSLSTKKNSYFWVRNVGTFATTGFIISQVVSPTGRSPSVEIRSCSGVWDVVKDTCTGVITTLLTTSDGASGAATVPIPLLVGEAVQLAAYPTKNGMTTAVSASVDRTAIRAPVTTHG